MSHSSLLNAFAYLLSRHNTLIPLKHLLAPTLQAFGFAPAAALLPRLCSTLRRLNISVPAVEIDRDPSPWSIPYPSVESISTSNRDPPIQKQRTLATMADKYSLIPVPHKVHNEGALQEDGSAGCAVFSLTMEPQEEGWIGRRLPNYLRSTFCELHGRLYAVTLMLSNGSNGLIMCD